MKRLPWWLAEFVCAVIGHRWGAPRTVDQSATVRRCTRCGATRWRWVRR